MQIDSDTTLLVRVSKPFLRASVCTGNVQEALPPLLRVRIAGDGLTVARWMLRAALAPLTPLE